MVERIWVGGVGWRSGVSLRPDGGVGWFIEVVLLGSSLSLEHGRCQILGPNSQRYRTPNIGNKKCEGEYE
jgi:hypothetical protein